MREHDPDLDFFTGPKRPGAKGAAEIASPVVGRAVAAGRPETLGARDVLRLQREVGNAGVTALMAQRQEEDSPVKEVVRSSGSPLDRATRSLMESRLGHDFGDVEVHTDSKAGASARSVQAQAYTVGNHVVFGEGSYEPGTDQGNRTLAHELTHVVQQRQGPVDGTPAAGGINVSSPSDRFEQEAARAADSFTAAPPATAAAAGSGSAVQRTERDDQVQTLPAQRQEAPEEEAEETRQSLPLQRQEGAEEEEEQTPE
jgi:hypothetical protein